MRRFLGVAGLALIAQVGVAQHNGVRLNDVALDGVTAGGVSAGISDGVVKFQGSVPTANGLVSAGGTMAVLTGPITGSNMGTLTLNGGAQQDLTSLVNINAVNSLVNVLLNLNVNINSTVGSIVQANLGGKR